MFASKDLVPVVLDADYGPTVRGGALERLLGTACVGEFAISVVVKNEEPQVRPVVVLREIQHRDVAVGVACSENRASAGAAPDPDRLLRAVVQGVRPRLLRDPAPPLHPRVSGGRR